MRLLRKGKVKDIYRLDNENILFSFSDRISAFDVTMATPIPRKGEVLCKFAKFWFDVLQTPHHMLRVLEKNQMEVEELQMIPIECVVRGYFYGSFVNRYKNWLGKELPLDFEPILATKLPRPIFDPTTKSEQHDVPINKHDAVFSGLISDTDYDYLEKTSILVYERMKTIVENAGFIIADVKLEFGRNEQGNIVLGDSLGPDEYRLWQKKEYQPGKNQESYDKQLLRDWLIKIGFKDKVDNLAVQGKKPDPPEIDPTIVQELSQRYIFAYERISGQQL